MKYAVYFRWISEDYKDSFNVNGLKELKLNINAIKENPDQEIISICQINKHGEYIPYNKIKF